MVGEAREEVAMVEAAVAQEVDRVEVTEVEVLERSMCTRGWCSFPVMVMVWAMAMEWATARHSLTKPRYRSS